jgi:hypothetical protein
MRLISVSSEGIVAKTGKVCQRGRKKLRARRPTNVSRKLQEPDAWQDLWAIIVRAEGHARRLEGEAWHGVNDFTGTAVGSRGVPPVKNPNSL